MAINQKGSPFYMVFRNGGRAPVVRHLQYEVAQEEAERISKACPGYDVFVLAVVSRTKIPRQVEQEFYESQHDAIPF